MLINGARNRQPEYDEIQIVKHITEDGARIAYEGTGADVLMATTESIVPLLNI